MTRVIGVRFRTAGKIYFFAPGEFDVKRGSHVIVETARGIEYGTVVGDIKEIEDEDVIQPLKPVLRIATEKDDEQEIANKIKEREAFQICLAKIREHGLDMKLIDAEYTFDNNKVLFYFTSDGRVDFRELVKDLASVFRTRIELRQVGVRDETKILGGIGICGRPLCCHTYLSDFIPVSIKMAKEQGLSLNPTKISGMCGRLMCCLKHEEETYEDLNRRLPNIGDYVTTPEGIRGEVHSVNVLRQKVKVLIEKGDEKEIQEFPVEELQFKKRFRREKLDVSEEELKLLKELENQDRQDSVENEENGGRRSRKGDRDRKNRYSSEDRHEKYSQNNSNHNHSEQNDLNKDNDTNDIDNSAVLNGEDNNDIQKVETNTTDIQEVLAEIKSSAEIDAEEGEARPRNERGYRGRNRFERGERPDKASYNDRKYDRERNSDKNNDRNNSRGNDQVRDNNNADGEVSNSNNSNGEHTGDRKDFHKDYRKDGRKDFRKDNHDKGHGHHYDKNRQNYKGGKFRRNDRFDQKFGGGDSNPGDGEG